MFKSLCQIVSVIFLHYATPTLVMVGFAVQTKLKQDAAAKIMKLYLIQKESKSMLGTIVVFINKNVQLHLDPEIVIQRLSARLKEGTCLMNAA